MNTWRDRFAAVPSEDEGGAWQGRYFQDVAIASALGAIAAGRGRILLTLATGNGTTFIAFQIAWKLFQSRWNLTEWKGRGEPTRRPRGLFLADRNIPADHAYNAYSAFPDDALVRIEPADIRKKGRVPKNGNTFFTTFQTFLFDVLAYVAFASEPVSRTERAATAKVASAAEYTNKQQAFVDHVLAQYIKQGVDELGQEKQSPLLKLKYNNAIADAFTELGRPNEVREVFVGLQRYLYQEGSSKR